MVRHRILFLVAFVWIFVFLAGCADRLPYLQPVTVDEDEKGRQLLDRMRKNKIPEALDADLELTWQGYGQTKNVAAELQAVKNGLFRLSVPDPIGRPMLLLVASEERFTLIDNRQGQVYTGPVLNKVVRKYIPAPFTLPLVYSLLIDGVPSSEPERIARDSENPAGFWYVFALDGGGKRLIMADFAHSFPLRQMLVSPENVVALDLRYSEFPPVKKKQIPARLLVSGEKIPGTVTIDFRHFYPSPAFGPSIFRLSVPASFTVELVDE